MSSLDSEGVQGKRGLESSAIRRELDGKGRPDWRSVGWRLRMARESERGEGGLEVVVMVVAGK